MTEKEKLIARLKALGEKLGREVITSGTIQELAMRIAELEEELDDDTQTDDDSTDDSQDTDTQDADARDTDSDTMEPDKPVTDDELPEQQGDLVQVKTLVTLHIDALHATRNERVSIVEPGITIRVSGKEADDLSSRKLVRKL